MKIAFVPFVFGPKPSGRRVQISGNRKKNALRLIGLSIYLIAATSAMFGWIWLLIWSGLDLFLSSDMLSTGQ